MRMLVAVRLALVAFFSWEAAGVGLCPGRPAFAAQGASRATPPVAQFPFKVQKSERLLIREAWERADSYRPGKANWFTTTQNDLVELHQKLHPEIEQQEYRKKDPTFNTATSQLGALLKSLTTGDLALTLCSKEPPVLTQLRDWLVEKLPMEVAILGIPEEQGRVLSTLVRAMDARKILDLGTFCGYSSIAMALAAADDATVVCCEPAAEYAAHAREWWSKAGVTPKMSMHECAANALMQKLLDEGEAGAYDFIFVDVGDRTTYSAAHELAIRLVHVGGMIVYYDTLWASDEVLQEEPYPAMRAFNQRLAKDPRVLSSLVPLSYGITLCFKAMDLPGPELNAALDADDDAAKVAVIEARRAEVEKQLAALP